MEYFKKISVKTVPQTIIDCPIRVQEIAIIQDTVKKDILGRIIFANQSKENIIAVFFDLVVKDISGEPIALNDSCFIYQDMIVSPGEFYGNKIAINLPDNARIFSVAINRIVFENGYVWKASEAQNCTEFFLEEIVLPQKNRERIKEELIKIIPDVDYINYYYQENESAWLCSCGKINPINNKICSFCGCEKNTQEAYLTKENFSSFCDIVNKIVENEEEKERAEATRKREEEKRHWEEEKEKRQKEAEERALEEKRIEEETSQKKKKRDKMAIAVFIPFVIIAYIAIWAFYNYYTVPKTNYDQAVALMNDGDYEEAYDIFISLDGYKDSDELASEANDIIAEDIYNSAKAYMDNGDYQHAVDILNDITWYKDSDELIEEANDIIIAEDKYNDAISYMDHDYYQQAIDLLNEITWYKDSDELIEEAEKQIAEINDAKESDSLYEENGGKTEDDKVSVYNDSSEVDEIIKSPHISFNMDPKKTRNLLKSYVSTDSIEVSYGTEYTFLNADFTSKQAAQLIGVPGLEDIEDIKSVRISFDGYDKMKRVRYDLEDLGDSSSFYDIKEEDTDIYEYIRELAYTITGSKNTDITLSDISSEYTKSGDLKYAMCYGKFEFDGYNYIITVNFDNDNVWEQYIGIEND